jgi:hypothetical protein
MANALFAGEKFDAATIVQSRPMARIRFPHSI